MMFGLYGFYWTPWDYLILIAVGISIWASFRVRGTFEKFSEVESSTGITGFEAARRMLDVNGLYDVEIEPAAGSLTDHYDPSQRTVHLSEPVYYSRSISAVAVACHEVGHAIQHKVDYPMLVLRHRIFPMVNFASGAAPFLLMIGLFFHFTQLFGLGIIFFSAAVFFQLVTLPVEFNASNRARAVMVQEGFISPQEEHGVAKVLNAAALTYVAAALVSLLQLLKFITLFQDRRD